MPRPRLPEMVERIDDDRRRHELVIAHVRPRRRRQPAPDRASSTRRRRGGDRAGRAAFAEIFAAAIELGGTITGEHGVGAAKLPYLAHRLGDDQMALLRRIKTRVRPGRHPQPGKLGS